jgi:hypothetical protein
MSWNTLATAAQMCQTLGFTRDILARPETREAKQRRAKLVWCIHMNDKMLALRLSRPALIRDGEITLNFEALEADGSDGPTPIIGKWARICDLQGRIYDNLYSPRALLQSGSQREAQARSLAANLHTLYHSKSIAEVSHFQTGQSLILLKVDTHGFKGPPLRINREKYRPKTARGFPAD